MKSVPLFLFFKNKMLQTYINNLKNYPIDKIIIFQFHDLYSSLQRTDSHGFHHSRISPPSWCLLLLSTSIRLHQEQGLQISSPHLSSSVLYIVTKARQTEAFASPSTPVEEEAVDDILLPSLQVDLGEPRLKHLMECMSYKQGSC